MRSVELAPQALEDLAWVLRHDRKLAARAVKLMAEAARSPFDGTGKPEPLRGELSGFWSRRINGEHRLVYGVEDERIRVIACRHHYG